MSAKDVERYAALQVRNQQNRPLCIEPNQAYSEWREASQLIADWSNYKHEHAESMKKFQNDYLAEHAHK